MELTTDGNCLADNQAIQEQYATGYSYNAAATVYMAKRYHAMEYESNTGLPINPSLPNFTTEYDTDEVLQGLGLYDCPELATDRGSLDELCSNYLGLGKGLKLEESFEFKEYSDDEEDEEDEEEYDEN
ncbi:hypothetical protein TWF128_001416 [Orbilia oligospora]|nr:hypothetical protein TWF128_001416 [Orbilia oligospora]